MCYHCGWIWRDDNGSIGEKRICDHCGAESYESGMRRIGGNWYCSECFDDVVLCEDCGEGVHTADATRCTCDTGDYYLCSNCIGGV